MTDNSPDARSPAADIPEAAVSSKRGFSMVWLIPIVAAVVALWLVYKNITETGPTIQIKFETGESLVAGKTKIRFRDVDIGSVELVDLVENEDGRFDVIVHAEMQPSTKKYLTDKTRFWVVRARVSAGEVAAIGTLFSGAYIAMDPSTEGKKTKEFVALRKPPVIDPRFPGNQYRLTMDRLGGLNRGSPVFHRGIEVGRVTDYALQDDGQILVDLFVESPHHQLVFENTLFWNAGGINLKLDATGVQLETDGLISVLQGGVSFDLQPGASPGAVAREKATFKLYRNHDAALAVRFTLKEKYVLFFDQSLRGLQPGAPLDFRGLTIGSVLDIGLDADFNREEIRMPVLVELEPERFRPIGEVDKEILPILIEQGLRAQLTIANLALGKKAVTLDFFPDAEPAKLDKVGRYPEIPTVRSAGADLIGNMSEITAELKTIPYTEIGQQMKTALADVGATMQQARALLATANSDIAPRLAESLDEAEKTLASTRAMLATDSVTRTELNRLLIELTEAAQAIGAVAEYLEQHPEGLIFGKGKKP